LSCQPVIGNADYPQDLYLAHGADWVGEPDVDVTAEVRWVPLEETSAMIASGDILGAITVIGVQQALLWRQAFSHLRREVSDRRNVCLPWPEPADQVAYVADTAGRVEAGGQVKGLPSNVARLLQLTLRCVRGGEQGQVEGPVAYVAAVHVQGTLGIPGGVARLAKVAEALCHASCQVRPVEVGEPCGVILAGCPVKRLFRCGKSCFAGAGIVPCGVAVCFHDEAFGEQGRRTAAAGSGLGGSGQVDGLT
jgi:hypothetical protein